MLDVLTLQSLSLASFSATALLPAWPMFVAASIAGLVDSMGGGGGLITVPTLLTIGVPPQLLLGTNKCVSTIGSLPAVFRYLRAGLIPRFKPAVAAGMVLAAASLSAYGASLSLRPTIVEHLPLIVPFLLFAVMGFMVKRWFWDEKNRLRKPTAPLPLTEVETRLRRPQYLLPTLGVAAYDGLLGPGTGTFFLSIFEGMGLDTIRANALTKIFNLASNVGALIYFVSQGKLIIALGVSAAAFYLIGNYIGAGFVLRRGQKLIRLVVLLATSGLLLKHLARYLG